MRKTGTSAGVAQTVSTRPRCAFRASTRRRLQPALPRRKPLAAGKVSPTAASRSAPLVQHPRSFPPKGRLVDRPTGEIRRRNRRRNASRMAYPPFSSRARDTSAAKRHWNQPESVEWFAERFRAIDERPGGLSCRRKPLSCAGRNPEGVAEAVRGDGAKPQIRRVSPSDNRAKARCTRHFVVKINNNERN